MSDDRPKNASRLSATEAAELTAQVAALAKSGLPLEPGLRALADELGGSRPASVLREMADRLEAGVPLDEVIRSQGNRFPAHLRGLLLAGIRSGRLAEVMEEFVDLHNDRRELNRRVWLSLAYPILLMSILSLLFFFVDQFLADGFAQVFSDFDARLPVMSQFLLDTSWLGAYLVGGGTGLFVLAVVLLAISVPGPPIIMQCLYRIPLVGPIWRWSRLVQFARMVKMLIEQGTPLPEALRLTADGLKDAGLASGCRRAADDVEAGRALSESLASSRRFPPTMIPLVDWGQRNSALPDAFEASAEVFKDYLQTQTALMERVLAPVVLLVVVGFLSLCVIVLFLPIMSLITTWTYFFGGQTELPAPETFVLSGLATIVLGIALSAAAAIITRSRDVSRDDTLLTVLSMAGWSLVAAGFVACCWFSLRSIGIIVVMVAAFAVGEIRLARRRAQRRTLLVALAAAAERFLPLVPVVKAFANERRDFFARRAHRLSVELTDGVPLPEALKRVRGLVPAEALSVIRVGHRSGALAAALRQVIAGLDSRNQLWTSLANKLRYLIGLAVIGACTLAYVMIKVVPSYKKIFEDFDADLPLMTRLLMFLAELPADFWFLSIPMLAAFLGFFFYIDLRYSGATHRELPGFERVARRLDTALIFDAMALAAEQQRPMHETVAVLADSYHKKSIRRRLRSVLDNLQSGCDWLDSFLRHGLIQRADLAILRAAGQAGNLPWALREMADSNRRRLAYRLYATLQVVFPIVILACGAVVAFIVVSLFIPLIVLISKLT